MTSDFDQMADSRAQRKQERLLIEKNEQAIDTARLALERVRHSHRRSIDRYVCSKIFLGLLLAVAALLVIICSSHRAGCIF